MTPLIEVKNITKTYPLKQTSFFGPKISLKALQDISFKVNPGQTLGIVGESGCGKSTLAKILVQLETATTGNVLFQGIPLESMPYYERFKKIQIVFQDPYSSLNPRRKIWEIVSEPYLIQNRCSKEEARSEAEKILAKVGLLPSSLDRYPHMFSGGQRQRINLARALILRPTLLLLDEPVAALDVSIQAQVLNLLKDLQQEFALTYIFISHDLSVVRYLCDEVAVMYLGKIVESGTAQELFTNPLHPYTQALLAASPTLSGEKNWEDIPLRGELPSPLSPPTGCVFSSRCPYTHDECMHAPGPSLQIKSGHQKVACIQKEQQ